MTHMEVLCGSLLQSSAVSSTDGLSSGPWLLPAQLGGGTHVPAQRPFCVRAFLCRVSPACPNNMATITAAEASAGDGGCCITGVGAPMQPPANSSPGKILQLPFSHWDGQRSPSMGARQPWAAPFPSRACLRGGHPWAPCPSPRRPAPLPFPWCRMFDMMTCSIEAMCCHNVTSLNKVFRAVFAEPEHEQQNPPITV